jgi:hypothetical protein
MPSRMWGIGSDARESICNWAVSGSTAKAERITIVPRSKGPTVAALIVTSESGCPWYGPAR